MPHKLLQLISKERAQLLLGYFPPAVERRGAISDSRLAALVSYVRARSAVSRARARACLQFGTLLRFISLNTVVHSRVWISAEDEESNTSLRGRKYIVHVGAVTKDVSADPEGKLSSFFAGLDRDTPGRGSFSEISRKSIDGREWPRSARRFPRFLRRPSEIMG